jgi:5-methylthioribose kinase
LDLDAITPGLAAEAKRLREDHGLVRQSQRLGDIYLEPGPCLLHGDFYPGSWLLSASGVKVIDPEFCKCGIPEFDLGVMAAHLTLIDSTRDWLSEIAKRYGELAGGGATEQESAPQRVPAPRAVDWPLAQKFCGVEIIRRLLGVAQLPLQASLAQKRHLLQIAQAAMLGPGVR